jgi:phosphatidylglycerophosphate synthase
MEPWGLGAAILGAILVHVASVLDGVDGEITRLQVRASSWAPCSTSCSTGSPTRR